MVGFSFFRLDNDNKAIEFYDKALAKGLDSGLVHFYKGVSLRYQKKYDEAMKEIEIAIEKEPKNQEYLNEKGFVFYRQDQLDKALAAFEQAKKLPKIIGDPFFWVARIYHEKNDFAKALGLYYEALGNLSKTNRHYLVTLENIGQLEYTFTKDYVKSAKAYAEAAKLNPENYDIYPKLMKAYNGGKDYAKADSVFGLMKVAYNNKKLSEDDMKFKNVAIDECEWKGQKISVCKYLVDPKESLDIFYKVYLLTKAGDKVERVFMVEQTFQLPDGPKYLLCEKSKKTGAHITYLYGWKTDNIPLDDLKKAVGLVLERKMTPGASSNFGDR